MSANSEFLPPVQSSEDFESLCLDLFRVIWNDPNAQKVSRPGLEQKGVDVVGRHDGRLVGVQCKQKDALQGDLLPGAVLTKEVEKAKEFKPQLASFILATTSRRDGALQEKARLLSLEAGFEVSVWSWDDIAEALFHRIELLRTVFPKYWPTYDRLEKLLPQRISVSSGLYRADRLFGRDARLAQLAAAWTEKKIRVLTLVAWGGVGKTSLVAKFADHLAARRYDGADYFEWSFYRQGSSEASNASADAFVDTALRFLGDVATADSQASACDKGEQLVKLLATRRTLLVLDGLEPLQYPPGPQTGKLKDPAIEALLKGLARHNAGLCVVTTREHVADLKGWEEDGTVQQWVLEHLETPAGVQLLESLGVDGSAAEMAKAVEEVTGHSLTLNLLGRYLKAAHGGDVRQRDLVSLDEADAEMQNHHAFRAIAAYERWFETEGEKGRQQLAVLRMLGFFDRPASAELLKVLRRPPAIAGLTAAVVELKDSQWLLTISRLVECQLITENDGSLDAHPLIREYFGRQLLDKNPEAWRAAHGRLFDHLKDNTEHHPEGLAALQPLYQAVHHGCQAGRHQEAIVDVYRDRILRGTGNDGFYSWKQLGVFGANLGALAGFFETPWSRVSPSLSEADQAWVLNEAALSLRALGRLREAVEPMRAGMDAAVRLEDWKNAAIYASNLSELGLTLGDVTAAVADAEQSVVFADRSGDAFHQMGNRTTLADARHQAGDESTALSHFREAERLQVERQPSYPLLYSLPGFQYCELLLAPAELAAGSGKGDRAAGKEACAEVERRALGAQRAWAEIFNNEPSILDIALDHISLGRARLYRAILDDHASQAAEDAQTEIENAVAGLRASGRLDYIPFGLLTRAWLRFVTGDEDGARADLDEAEEIAERGSMRLHLADVALYRARFFGDREALATARRLVDECGYGRRRAELAILEEQILGREVL